MSNKITQFSIDLLEKMYFHGFDSFYDENLVDLYPNYTPKDMKKAVQNLHNNGKIHVFGIEHLAHNFFLKQFSGYITDIGILEVENYDFSDNTKYSVEIARFLEVVDDAVEDTLNIDKIVNEVRQKGSIKTEQELLSLFCMVIEWSCHMQKMWAGGTNKYSKPYITNLVTPITDYGYHILDLYNRTTQLFKNPILTNQEMLMKEYSSLQICIENQLWKDVCIKMGAILEYLLTKWLISKNVTHVTHSKQTKPRNLDRASFRDKIMFYLEILRIKFNNEIGDNTSWNIAKDLIREYRNCVHLEKYEEIIKTDGYLDKKDYDQLLPAFSQIIQHFQY